MFGVDSCLVHQNQGIQDGYQQVMSNPTTSSYESLVMGVIEFYAQSSIIDQLETFFEARSVVQEERRSVLDQVHHNWLDQSWLLDSHDWQQIKDWADRSLSSMCLRVTLIPEWYAVTSDFKPLCKLEFKMQDPNEELNYTVNLVEMPEGSDPEEESDGTRSPGD